MALDLVLGADHAGLTLADELVRRLRRAGLSVRNLSPRRRPSDYPDVAAIVADEVVRGEARRGLLVCGSGVGASVAANKLPGLRAGVCHDCYSARQGVEHDDMNVLVLGARVVGVELATTLVESFLAARFSSAPRHLRRLQKVRRLEVAAARAASSRPSSPREEEGDGARA